MSEDPLFNIATVSGVHALITPLMSSTDNDTDSYLYECNVINLSTAYRVNSIPECSCLVYPDVPDGSTYDEVLGEIISKVGDKPMWIQVHLWGDYKTLSVLFEGIITEASVATNMTTYGSSSKCLSIRATHAASKLFLTGTAGMVYVTPDSIIEPGDTLSSIIEEYERKRGQLMNDNVVGTVLKEVVNDKTQTKSTAAALTLLIKALTGQSTLVKDGVQPIAGAEYVDTNVVKGSAKLNYKDSSTDELIQTMLDAMYKTICTSTVGDGVLTAILKTQCGLIIAPRSTKELWIVPDLASLLHSGKIIDTPMIPSNMIISMSMSRADDPYPNPVGVLLTRTGSDLMAPNNLRKQGGVIIAQYPKAGKGGDVSSGHFVSIQAPRWLTVDHVDNTKKTDKSNGNAGSDVKYTAYAKMMYDRLRYKNNGCTVTTDIRGILAFQVLGMPCIINPYTVTDDTLVGRLDSYGLTYSTGGIDGNSNIGVSLSFTYVRPFGAAEQEAAEGGDNVVNKDTCMYNIKTLDSVTKFPVWPPENTGS